ncbi:MAG: hypothetical protein K6F86_10730 [Lachnospiraceae bacterium]|nr:hypothetical protein [Lachnospiraceae bacterium]
MKRRANELKKAIDAAEKKKEGFPEGRLRISRSGRQIRYYHVVPSGNSSGTYITRDKREIVKVLAQKNYTGQFIAAAKKELSRLEYCIRLLLDIDADQVYQGMTLSRKQLIEPYILPDELYAARWLEKEYKSNPYNPEGKIYETRNGEMVRSKSEAILADMLYELQIPYHYEQSLKLRNNIIRYPDFTLLKEKTRELIYLEHFGLLNDEQYRTDCLKKLGEYRNNGIYPGKNLLITLESKDCPLDISGTRKMLKEIFQ